MNRFVIQEIFPYRKDGRYQLVKEAPELQVVDGYLVIPELPGLGVELDEDVISRYDSIRLK
jgi:L-alanine-DL-glutamate epimerase-like enolase superfamily enzyme